MPASLRAIVSGEDQAWAVEEEERRKEENSGVCFVYVFVFF